MKFNNIPLMLAAVLIVALTLAEARLSDRWHDSSVDAAQFGALFKNVPTTIGSWKGVDQDVEEDVREKAGAVNYVSRQYTDSKTGRWVTLWLIVGHARDVCRHTPNICYPSAGFKQDTMVMKHHIVGDGDEVAIFNTAKFEKSDEMSRHTERVFWAWNHPDRNKWEAPDNQRLEYGNSRALYKLYFTAQVMKDEKVIDDNIAAEFANLALPHINKALFPETGTSPDGATSTDGAVTPGNSTDGPSVDGEEKPAKEKSVYDAVS